MNQYGAMAMKHWEEFLPLSYRGLTDPQAFFTTLGREVEEAIAQREMELRHQILPSDDFLRTARAYWTCHLEAEQQVLREMVYIEPEIQEDDPPLTEAPLRLLGPANPRAALLGLDREELTPEEEAEADRLLDED
jgi:hypothetical protein